MTSWCHECAGGTGSRANRACVSVLAVLAMSLRVALADQVAQDPHAGMQHDHRTAPGWTFMQDAASS